MVLPGVALLDWLVVGVIRAVRRGRRRVQLVAVRRDIFLLFSLLFECLLWVV